MSKGDGNDEQTPADEETVVLTVAQALENEADGPTSASSAAAEVEVQNLKDAVFCKPRSTIVIFPQ